MHAALVIVLVLALWVSIIAALRSIDTGRAARMLLAVAGAFRYRSRWLEAVQLIEALEAEFEQIRAAVEQMRVAADRALASGEQAVEKAARDREANLELVAELQETIARLSVEVALLEGVCEEDLAARSMEISRAAAWRQARR